MTAFHQLEQKLKLLKLGGMLTTIEQRIHQAEDGHLGYLDFLELLLEDEIERRSDHRLSLRIARARFDQVQTFEEFDFAADPSIPTQQIRDLATCRFLERHASLIICGPVGVGKTHVARALGVEACRRGYAVVFSKTARLLRDLAGGHADGSWEQRFRAYLRADVLILDDFAMQEFTGPQAEDLYQLIDERVGRSSLIVTSNRSPQDWYPLFPNPVLAESILDRLAGTAHQITLTGKSYRPRLRASTDAGTQTAGGTWPWKEVRMTLFASRNVGVTIACGQCGRAFGRSGRRRFCSDACRQAAWRRRHTPPPPSIPHRAARVATVYQCPTCDQQYLGEQRCPDCGVFCHRVGPGGLCPHCDEPVALADLLPAVEGGEAAFP